MRLLFARFVLSEAAGTREKPGPSLAFTSTNSFSETKIKHARAVIGCQIPATVRQIDAVVREMYGLSEEEIIISEGRYSVEVGNSYGASSRLV